MPENVQPQPNPEQGIGTLEYLKQYLNKYTPHYKFEKGQNGKGAIYIIHLLSRAEELDEEAKNAPKTSNVGNAAPAGNPPGAAAPAAPAAGAVPMQQAAKLLKKEFPKEFLKSMGLI